MMQLLISLIDFIPSIIEGLRPNNSKDSDD